MSESRVPSSRIERIWQYGGLATGMTFGAIGEGFRRVTQKNSGGSSLLLNERNIERLVSRFSRLRGAALKLGQMISFQGNVRVILIANALSNNFLIDLGSMSAPIREILQKVQDRADYMPVWQRDRVLIDELGSEWRNMFKSFDEIPMAAASIGQVHRATLKASRREVAVKIQYPGVADSIESDLNNFAIIVTASKLLPKGLYLNKTIDNARKELAWECDYVREASCMRRFASLLEKDNAFIVPQVINEASGRRVITSEMMHGTAVAKAQSLSQAEKDWIGTNILRLCLRELAEFKFMQTDPNWTNFLFNKQSHKIELLDFGASREFPNEFVHLYTQTLEAASRSDRSSIHALSKHLGYLTDHDSPRMVEAHIDSVMALAEPFGEMAPAVYDFSEQTITQRVRELIPLMLRERLVPPPEETYSLHRKLSGAFLLCARLGSRVGCREIFASVMGSVKSRKVKVREMKEEGKGGS